MYELLQITIRGWHLLSIDGGDFLLLRLFLRGRYLATVGALRTALATAVSEEGGVRHTGGDVGDGAAVALVSEERPHPAEVVPVPPQAPQALRVLQQIPEVSIAGHCHDEPLQPSLGVDSGDIDISPVPEHDVEGGGERVAGAVQTHRYGVGAAGWDEADPEWSLREPVGPLTHIQLVVSGSPHQQSVKYLQSCYKVNIYSCSK